MAKALELAEVSGKAYMPSQFDNPANPTCTARPPRSRSGRYRRSGPTIVVSGVGTGGTITASRGAQAQEGLVRK